jgi:hypothetical protein
MMNNLSKIKISFDGILHRTPVWANYLSIILIAWGTYEPAIHEFVHDAPFGTIEVKDYVMSWLNWICPALGFAIQFLHRNYEYNRGEQS